MLNIELPIWLKKGEVVNLSNAAKSWWQDLASYLGLPAKQRDVDQCEKQAVKLLGWERDIDPYSDETEEQYKNRVRHAMANAKDAGTIAGFHRILNRLGVGFIETNERITGQDWDIVELKVTDEIMKNHGRLLRVLVDDYGRTCRRYRLTFTRPEEVTVLSATLNHRVIMLEASV